MPGTREPLPPAPPSARVAPPMRTLLLALAAGLCASACHDNSSSSPAELGNGLHLTEVVAGRLVDVYGLRVERGVKVLELYRRDVLVGPGVQDQRSPLDHLADEQILHDFLLPDGDTLQPRLLITRELGSEEFTAAFAALDDTCPQVRITDSANFSLVARDAALRLQFSAPLPVADSFFYERDPGGTLTGVKHIAAAQLLERVPNPTISTPELRPVPARVSVSGNHLILDPVLHGTETHLIGRGAAQAGMPESATPDAANILISLALTGAAKIPGLSATGFAGSDDQGNVAQLIALRSGQVDDATDTIRRGMWRSAEAPVLVSGMRLYLESILEVSPGVQELILNKDGLVHELDRFDEIELRSPDGAQSLGGLLLLGEPEDDEVQPEVQRVRVLVATPASTAGRELLRALDPRRKPGFPPTPGPERQAWLRAEGTRAMLRAPFTALRPPRSRGLFLVESRDRPENFLRFVPDQSVDGPQGQLEGVSPFAGAVLRFSTSLDLAAIDPLEQLFFATRDLFDAQEMERFRKERGIDPEDFSQARYRTPHLIHARVFAEDHSGAVLRLQPALGFYLDEAMRDAAAEDAQLPFAQRRYHYHLHLLAGPEGLRDRAGRPLDLLATAPPTTLPARGLVAEFELDCSRDGVGKPAHPDNLVVTVARRFAAADEDPRPSYYRPDEVTPQGLPTPRKAMPVTDLFGAVSVTGDGQLRAQALGRVSRVFDDRHGVAIPPQADPVLRWCPWESKGGFASGFVEVVHRLPNPHIEIDPFNHWGCRMQVLWREIDLSLSRTDPSHFNLEVEQIYWSPHASRALQYDRFDRASLFLGHAEQRPVDCTVSQNFPTAQHSGLRDLFADNFAHNLDTRGQIEERPAPHPAYRDVPLEIHPKDAVSDPRGRNLFVPLPDFEDARQAGMADPYFVWRDERVMVQGGESGVSATVFEPFPYLLSPFMGGRGDGIVEVAGQRMQQSGRWHNGRARRLDTNQFDSLTGGMVGSIALPLLADFWVHADASVTRPKRRGAGWLGNAWQSMTTVGSGSIAQQPTFRLFSGGSPAVLTKQDDLHLDPNQPAWSRAAGRRNQQGAWIAGRSRAQPFVMMDFRRRLSVATAGFVELHNPHRVAVRDDPRLGPFDTLHFPIHAAHDLRIAGGQLPAGTSVHTEFRTAGRLMTPGNNWPISAVLIQPGGIRYDNPTTPDNFPLDPRKAGDAHIRHFDGREVSSSIPSREYWSYQYNHNLTRYTEDPETALSAPWLQQFAGPHEQFGPSDLRYINWRFLMQGNLEASPPVSPALDSFALSYRFW